MPLFQIILYPGVVSDISPLNILLLSFFPSFKMETFFMVCAKYKTNSHSQIPQGGYRLCFPMAKRLAELEEP